MTNTNNLSFIDAVELRAIEIGRIDNDDVITSYHWRKALTEIIAKSEKVGWQQRYIDPEEGPSIWKPCEHRDVELLKERKDYELRQIFTHPAPSELAEVIEKIADLVSHNCDIETQLKVEVNKTEELNTNLFEARERIKQLEKHREQDKLVFDMNYEEINQLRTKLAELESWKASQMLIFEQLNLQAIGKELNVPLGEPIAPKVLPRIYEMKALMECYYNQIYP